MLNLAGLTLVTPPIWTILCSVRIVITAVIYKFVLKRDITVLQFIGAVLILVSIIFAKLGINNKLYKLTRPTVQQCQTLRFDFSWQQVVRRLKYVFGSNWSSRNANLCIFVRFKFVQSSQSSTFNELTQISRLLLAHLYQRTPENSESEN